MEPERVSAGLMLFRIRNAGIEVLLVHPGGPYYARKDAGYWSIPKGEVDPGEDELAAARREFREETGLALAGQAAPLGRIALRRGKTVVAWAIRGDIPAGHRFVSGTCRIDWPPGSGRQEEIPEVDRWEFFGLADAARMISPAQAPLLERLAHLAPDLP
jgi:predicted NUDIX family NTP pyrophosphohydrolase